MLPGPEVALVQAVGPGVRQQHGVHAEVVGAALSQDERRLAAVSVALVAEGPRLVEGHPVPYLRAY